MDNVTHNSGGGSSWDLDMSLGSHHHHHLLFDHPAPTPPPPPPTLPFDLRTPPHLPLDPSPSSSLFPPPPPHHHHHHHLNPLDLGPSSHRRHHEPRHDQEELRHEDAASCQDTAAGDDAEEELGAMKEMMYRIAAMQPVDIDPATIKKPRRRNVRISDDPQSVAARHRRERISERIRVLQRLVPGGTKMDTASMLDEGIRYIKFLKRQVQELQHQPPAQQYPAGASAGAPAGTSTSVVGPPGRAGGPFMPLGAGPVINWAVLTRPVDIGGPTSSSMGGAHAALGFGFSSGGQAAMDKP